MLKSQTPEKPLSAAEYAQALEDVQSLNSKLILSQRAALQKQISKLSTLNGKIEQTETAKTEAAHLVENITLAYAEQIRVEALTRWNDAPGTGKRRLEEATFEANPTTSKKSQAEPDVPRITKTTEPAPHGSDRRYRAGCSCQDCRKAHAGTQRRYRVERERREHEQVKAA